MASRALKRRRNIRKHDIKSGVLTVLFVIIGLNLVLGVGIYTLCDSWLKDIPDYSQLSNLNNSSVSKVYASDGETVLAEFQLENRTPVELDQVCDYVKKGTVATEDERFYNHNGFDLYGTLRATVNNLIGGSLEGGSTITMQLARNTVITDEMTDRTFKRKVREIYISLKMEELYSKDEILQLYLNTINYGSGAYGIEAASIRYFSKSAKDLTLNEAATLIGIPQSPTYNNPIDNMEQCVARRNVVLARMVSNNIITQAQADEVMAQEIVLNPTEASTSGIQKYPYFTSYVRNQLTNNADKYGLTSADLFGSGLSVITTLDLKAQEDLDTASDGKADASGFQVASCVVEPSNGYITAIHGGGDYNESQINLVTGEGTNGRQVGSTFKVFTLIAAIEKGINPSTMIDCGYSVTMNGSEIHNYNYINYGTRSIASALAVSSNTGFVRLCNSVTPEKVIEVARRMGVTSDLPSVPTLTLGVASITPLQMANAFACIANGGTYYEPECIVKISDSSGKVLVDNSNPVGTRAMSAETAHAATEAMKTVVTSGTGVEARPSTQTAAGKSGTTDDYKDAWWVGITPQASVAFWMGDLTANYSDARSCYSTAQSAFKVFIDNYLEGQSNVDFPEANDPPYDSSFYDEENHIGGYWSSGYSYGYNNYSYNYGYNNYGYNNYNYNYNYNYNSNSSGSNSNSNSNSSNSTNNSSGNSSSGNSSSNSTNNSTNNSSSTNSNSGTSQNNSSTSSGANSGANTG